MSVSLLKFQSFTRSRSGYFQVSLLILDLKWAVGVVHSFVAKSTLNTIVPRPESEDLFTREETTFKTAACVSVMNVHFQSIKQWFNTH
jgi:hypothetical protein